MRGLVSSQSKGSTADCALLNYRVQNLNDEHPQTQPAIAHPSKYRVTLAKAPQMKTKIKKLFHTEKYVIEENKCFPSVYSVFTFLISPENMKYSPFP